MGCLLIPKPTVYLIYRYKERKSNASESDEDRMLKDDCENYKLPSIEPLVRIPSDDAKQGLKIFLANLKYVIYFKFQTELKRTHLVLLRQTHFLAFKMHIFHKNKVFQAQLWIVTKFVIKRWILHLSIKLAMKRYLVNPPYRHNNWVIGAIEKDIEIWSYHT